MAAIAPGIQGPIVPKSHSAIWQQDGGRKNLILNRMQARILHQSLGIRTGFGGDLRKLRFLWEAQTNRE
jgi:hypothetical protein